MPVEAEVGLCAATSSNALRRYGIGDCASPTSRPSNASHAPVPGPTTEREGALTTAQLVGGASDAAGFGQGMYDVSGYSPIRRGSTAQPLTSTLGIIAQVDPARPVFAQKSIEHIDAVISVNITDRP